LFLFCSKSLHARCHHIWGNRTLGNKPLATFGRIFSVSIAAALLVVAPGYAQQNADPEIELQYGQDLSAEEAIQIVQREPDNVAMVHHLGLIYSATGDQSIVEELRRLVRESENPDVREAAASNLAVEPEQPDEAVAPGGPGKTLSTGPVEPLALPSDVDAVLVECNGSCSDNTLGELCVHAIVASPKTPIAVSCNNAQDGVGSTTQCGGSSNNRCDHIHFNNSTPLSNLCDDTSGWDAIVYCAGP
jgi:hypothetical protein